MVTKPAKDQPMIKLDDPSQTDVAGYKFDEIKGYPRLRWQGKRPFSSTQYYPAQLREVHGEESGGWRNKIYWGDNLQVMSHLLKDFRGKIDLIYIDPPFDSKADYKKRIQLRGQLVENDTIAFEEKQYADIWLNDEYLQFMYERIILMRELLAENGVIFLHCDWHKAHYLRCLMDEVFGENNFINEVIWQRGNNKKTTNKFSVAHDNLYLYAKSADYKFIPQYTEYSEEYINDKYPNIENGRRYQLQAMYGKGGGPALYFGDRLISPPAGLHWRWGQEKINQAMKDGIIVFPRGGEGMPRFKDFLDTKEGIPVRTIWDDLVEVNSQAEERENYPTQKPECLLERVIKAVTSPNDLVFDCFMGSGTTQSVAIKMGRRFIGADINLGAIQVTTKRVLKIAKDGKSGGTLLDDAQHAQRCGFEVYNVNHYDVFRNPVEARDLLLAALEINKMEAGTVWDGEKDGWMIKLMPVNRIATKADLNELITGVDWKAYEKRSQDNPNKPVEKIRLVCMGHEPDLAAQLKMQLEPNRVEVEVLDILRDKSKLEFKRDSQARIITKGKKLIIEKFYPMNLLQKLSLQKEEVRDWRELTDSVMIDWNYDGVIFTPTTADIPGKDELVKGEYAVPADAGTIRVKITDLLSETWEGNIHD